MEAQDGAELCFPQLLNASCWKPKRHQSDAVLLYLQFFITVLTVVLNLLVIVSVSHFRQLHTPTNLLLLSLAVSDLLLCLMVTLLEVHRQTSYWFLGDSTCFGHIFVSSFTMSASIGDMLLISADRYVAICDPLHYSTRVTEARVQVCVCLCWFFSVFYTALIFREDLAHPARYNSCYRQCVAVVDFVTVAVDTVLTFVVPFSSIIFLYMRVFLTAVSQARAMRSHVTAVTLHHSETVVTKRSELKAARMLGVVVAVFLLCFCPYYCLSLAGISFDSSLTAVSGVFLLCLSRFLNPVIYALFYPWFRKALRLIFNLQILQPGPRENNML